jgi:ATP-dependent helicase/nuclease subunit B
MSHILYNDAYSLKFSKERIYFNIQKLLDSAIKSSTIQDFVIIVPTNRIVRYLELEIIQKYFNIHKKPLGHLKLFNLESLINEFFNIFFDRTQFQDVSDALRLVLIEEALQSTNLEYYKFPKNRIKLEVSRKLSEIIYGLREDGYTAQQATEELLKDEIENYKIIDRRKNNDILNLIISYENLLKDNLIDLPIIFKKVIDKLKSNTYEQNNTSLINTFGKNATFLFVGFSEFKNPESEFISQLSKSQIPTALFLDYSESNGPLFGSFQDVIKQLTNNGFNSLSEDKIFEDFGIDEFDDNSYKLRKYLFNFNNNPININFADYVTIFKALNTEDEVKSIVKLVKYLNLKQNVPLNQIAIVSRNPQEYSELFREQFRKERIPSNISDRFPLRNSPVVNTIMSILEVYSTDFKLEALQKIFSSGNISIDEQIDLNNIIDVILELKISKIYYSFRKNYIVEKVLAYEKYLQFSLEKYPKDYHLQYKNKELLKKIEKFKIDFEKLTKLFNSNFQKIKVSEIETIVFEIIDKFRIKETLRNKNKSIIRNKSIKSRFDYYIILEEIEKEAKAFDSFLNLINEFVITFKSRFGDVEANLTEWLERLKIAVADERFQIPEKTNYGVAVTSIEQIRMLPFQVKILCGANDGKIPLSYSSEIYLGKELLNAREQHIRKERINFYQFLSNSNLFNSTTSQSIFIFMPLTSSSENLSPSPFIEILIKMSDLGDKVISIESARKSTELLQNYPWLSAITHQNEIIDKIIKTKIFNQTLNPELVKLNEENNFISEEEVIRIINIINRESSNSINLSDAQLKAIYEHNYSISELEKYAACPFSYYVDKILKIKVQEPKEYKLEPVEEGSLFHNILFNFYNLLLSQGDSVKEFTINQGNLKKSFNVVSLDKHKEEFYKKLLLEIIDEMLENPAFDHPFIQSTTKNFKSFEPAKNPALYWLKKELQKIDAGWKFYPLFFEKEFRGEFNAKDLFNDDDDFASELIDVPPLKILSKPDRVEIGEIDGKYYVAIGDYKLSEGNIKTNNNIIKDFTSFQMPIYLLSVINEFAQDKINVLPAFGVYYILTNKSGKENSPYTSYVLLDNPALVQPFSEISNRNTKQVLKNIEIKEALHNSLKEVFKIRQKISQGLFPVSPKTKQTCDYCKFDSFCRRRTLF